MQKVDHSNSEQTSSLQIEQTVKDSSNTLSTRLSPQTKQTAKDSSITDKTPPGRVGAILLKVISDNQIDLRWTGVKDSDLDHYNIYIGMKSSFKVSPGLTLPSGTSGTDSYSSSGLKPSTKYYFRIAAVDNSGNIGTLSSIKSGVTDAVGSAQTDSPPGNAGGLQTSSIETTASSDTTPPAQVTGLVVSTVSSSQLNLAWNKVTASDFNHYNVYRGTTSGFTVSPGLTAPAGTTVANSYSSTGLNPSTTYYYKVAAVDNANNIGPLSSEKSGTTSSSSSGSTNSFSDNFDTSYSLPIGATSPDGKWRDKYIGSGKVASENGVMHMVPKTATGTTDSSGVGYETYAALVLSKQSFKNFQLDFDMKTNKQLRTNTAPNNWETAWIFFRFTDEDPKSNHHYYFLLRKNGYEFGKKDNAPNDNGLEQQIYLKTGTSPSVSIGSFQHVTVIANNFHFTIKVNGNTVVDMDDPHVYDSTKMAQGLIGMYTEDADVSFDNVKVTW